MEQGFLLLIFGFVLGMVGTGFTWAFSSILGRRDRSRAQRDRLDAVTELGKLQAEVDSLVTSRNLGDILDTVFRKRLTSLLDSLNRRLRTSMHLIDGYHVKYFESSVQHYWHLLYPAPGQTAVSAPVVTINESAIPGAPALHEFGPEDLGALAGIEIASPAPPLPEVPGEKSAARKPAQEPAGDAKITALKPEPIGDPVVDSTADLLSESLSTQETMKIDVQDLRAHLRDTSISITKPGRREQLPPAPETNLLVFDAKIPEREECPIFDLQPENIPPPTEQIFFRNVFPAEPVVNEAPGGSGQEVLEELAPFAMQEDQQTSFPEDGRTGNDPKSRDEIMSGEDVVSKLDSFFGFSSGS